jgi:hypothetical protein
VASTVGGVFKRFYIPSLLVGVAIALTFALSGSASASSVASASTTCKAPKYPGSGYFTSLSVTKVSCSTGGKVAKAWYSCRLKHGVKGRCTKKVLGYSCKETRQTIATEIDARVTCKSGSKKVVHTYQQDT